MLGLRVNLGFITTVRLNRVVMFYAITALSFHRVLF